MPKIVTAEDLAQRVHLDYWIDRWGPMTVLDESSGCWVWMGATTRRGYGQVSPGVSKPKTRRLHRFIYIIVNGDPGDEMVIDHTCHNDAGCKLGEDCWHRRCWNPDHLKATTDLENKRNAGRQGLALLEECINGHDFTPENTYRQPRGGRACKACHKERNRIYAERKRREAGVPELGRRVKSWQ